MPNDKDLPKFTSEEEKEYYEKMYQLGYALVKSVRNDAKNFWYMFLRGILGKDRTPLRAPVKPGQDFKLTARTIVQRSEDGKFPPRHTAEEKADFSKKQSTSVVAHKYGYLSKVFGWNRQRKDELTGIIFFSDSIEKDTHLLPSINLMYDSSTYERPYYFSAEEAAEEYFELHKDKQWHPTVKSLIRYGKTMPDNYNEVLARLKWIPGDPRCQIGIFSDNLSSRLIAQLRAIDVQNDTREDFIPISFYIPARTPPFSPYLLREQKEDLLSALSRTDIDPTIKAQACLVWYRKYHEIPSMEHESEIAKTTCYNKVIPNILKLIIQDREISINMTSEFMLLFKYAMQDEIIRDKFINLDIVKPMIQEHLADILIELCHFSDLQAFLSNLINTNIVTDQMLVDALLKVPSSVRRNIFTLLLPDSRQFGDLLKILPISLFVDFLPETVDIIRSIITESKDVITVLQTFSKDSDEDHKKFLILLDEIFGEQFIREKINNSINVNMVLKTLSDHNLRLLFLRKYYGDKPLDVIKIEEDNYLEVFKILYNLGGSCVEFIKSHMSTDDRYKFITKSLNKLKTEEFVRYHLVIEAFVKATITDINGVIAMLKTLSKNKRKDFFMDFFIRTLGVNSFGEFFTKRQDVTDLLKLFSKDDRKQLLEMVVTRDFFVQKASILKEKDSARNVKFKRN